MSVDRALLRRYLRQRGELGERELLLESFTAAEVLARLRVPAPAPRQPDEAAAVAAAASARVVAGPDPETVPDTGRGGAAPASAPGTAPVDGGIAGEPGAGDRAGADGPALALRVLGQEAAGCTRCRLHETRNRVVFGEGDPAAELVVVGEAPGGEEDRTGRPFVGPAGHLLDLLLLTIGLPRERVYICNVLKCRPPRNRDPMRDEVEACSSYLHRQLDLISPRALLAVGKFAAQMLAGSEASIGRLRGRVHEYRGTPLVATYHPAYLLRSSSRVRAVWQDLQLVREILDK